MSASGTYAGLPCTLDVIHGGSTLRVRVGAGQSLSNARGARWDDVRIELSWAYMRHVMYEGGALAVQRTEAPRPSLVVSAARALGMLHPGDPLLEHPTGAVQLRPRSIATGGERLRYTEVYMGSWVPEQYVRDMVRALRAAQATTGPEGARADESADG